MHISIDTLEEALSIRRQMEMLEKRLGALLGHSTSPDSTTGKGHRHMSAATRAKIAAAALARWARVKGRAISIAHKSQRKKSGGLTPAGRRRLSQLMKRRWAARRKAAGKA